MANRHLQLQNSLCVHGNGSPIINKKNERIGMDTYVFYTHAYGHTPLSCEGMTSYSGIKMRSPLRCSQSEATEAGAPSL